MNNFNEPCEWCGKRHHLYSNSSEKCNQRIEEQKMLCLGLVEKFKQKGEKK